MKTDILYENPRVWLLESLEFIGNHWNLYLLYSFNHVTQSLIFYIPRGGPQLSSPVSQPKSPINNHQTLVFILMERTPMVSYPKTLKKVS